MNGLSLDTDSVPSSASGEASGSGSKPLSLQTLASGLDANPLEIPTFLSSLLPSSSSASASDIDLAALDISLNEILTRLTLLSQDTSSALEQSISDISRTVPRLNYDLQFMRESATTLQGSLNSVQGKVRRVDEYAYGSGSGSGKGKGEAMGEGSNITTTSTSATTKSLEKLVHLDKLKTRMESARDILREAESWSTLESEITSSISSSEWEKAGARLSEAGRSMVVFQSTPAEYDTRKTLLVSLQNELETALSAALGIALDEGDVEACARFYAVFESMNRAPEFNSYYYTKRRGRILDEWASFDGEGLATFLPRFYTVLLQVLDKEVEQMERIFPSGRGKDTLSAFLQTSLDSLSPSLKSRLSSMADSLGTTALPELIKAYKATEEVALAIHAILDRMSSEVSSPVTPITPNRPIPRKRESSQTHTMQTPHRMSVFDLSPEKRSNGLGREEDTSQWETTLFEAFLELQTAYSTLERRYLLHLLRSESLSPSHHSSSSSKKDANAFSDRSLTIFHLATEAIARCMAFTHGYGTLGLISALSDFLSAFFENSHSILDVQPPVAQDELDFGMDYSTEDWAAFQAGLHILKVCRDVSGRLDGFEEKLVLALKGALEPPLPISTPEGAITLLRQSTLNSSDLHSLLARSASPTTPTKSASNPHPASTSTQRPPLLPPAHLALSDLTRAAQTSLGGIILSPLRTALTSYPSLPAWTQPARSARRDGLSIPTFSLSPTDTIARVSEGLLNLLRVFEVYAKDPALSFSLGTLPHISESALPTLSASSSDSKSSGENDVYPAEVVLSAWISSLALTLLSHLTNTTLPAIPKLTTPGANQLAADLGYLENAVRALDVEWADLERWREGAEATEEVWRGRMTVMAEGDGEGKEVWTRIGRIRGWVSV